MDKSNRPPRPSAERTAPSRDMPYPLRLPPELRARLEAAARAEKRSLHGEILHRLHGSLEAEQPTVPPSPVASLLDQLEQTTAQLRVALSPHGEPLEGQ